MALSAFSASPQRNGQSREQWKRHLEKLANYQSPNCDPDSKYEKLTKIGQGTFGEVFKARHRVSREVVALKKVLVENEREGFPVTALREIKILQALKHVHIVKLKEICHKKGTELLSSMATFYLVFEFCEHDLAGLIKNRSVSFSLGEIKMVMKQLLNGLFYIHYNKIIHRDMKSANILITKQGVLKLADFGLARAIGARINNQPKGYTSTVVTLWYRPPEILLGERHYGPSIDIWGAGCIMAEMWTRQPVLKGSSELMQLELIIKLCGSINPQTFPGVEKLKIYNQLELPTSNRKLKERLKAYTKDLEALDLIDKMLIINPAERIDADGALDHDFFYTDPKPVDLQAKLALLETSNFDLVISNEQNRNARMLHGSGPALARTYAPVQNHIDNEYVECIY